MNPTPKGAFVYQVSGDEVFVEFSMNANGTISVHMQAYDTEKDPYSGGHVEVDAEDLLSGITLLVDKYRDQEKTSSHM